MNINIFDSAIIIAAIAGGITGALVALVVSLGVIRGQRHLGGTAIAGVRSNSVWRTPSGPLARHLAQPESGQTAQADEPRRPSE